VTITVDGNGHPTLTFPDGTAVTLEGLTAPSTDSTDATTANWLVALGIPVAPNYIVEGTSGGDLINGSYTGDPEGDMVDANDNQDGDNDDSIDAGEGNDTIYAGEGDDTVRADEGDDEVYGGAGNDSIFGFEGSDTVDGGDGNDYINTRTSPGTGEPDATFTVPDNHLTTGVDESLICYGPDSDPNNDRDSVIGGAGNDTILTGDDDDTIQGGTGEDHIDAGYDDDSVDAGANDDTVVGNEGNDNIDGGDGDDVIYGGLDPNETYEVNGVTYTGAQVNALYSITDDLDPNTTNNNDSLVGGAGNDTIFGQDDEDTLEGGSGNDVLDGGIDDDTVIGGTGNDVMTGGEVDDTFVLDLAGNDTITDFGSGISGGINDDDQSNNDFIDLSGSYDRLKDLRDDFADDGILNHSNSTANGGNVDYTGLAAITGGLTLTGAAATALTWDTTNVMCFTVGTLIRTIDGLVPAEEITQGMLVWTKDDGYQPVRWVGARKMSKHDLAEHSNVRPIRIKAGALGQNVPERDLMVSPQHRILVHSKLARRLFGEDEVLVAAKHLLQVDGIDVVQNSDEVIYVHFLFDRHQIVESEGAETESLFTWPEALETVDPEARIEILSLFPELADIDYDRLPDPVRPILSGRQGRKLANRHANNKKYLAQ